MVQQSLAQFKVAFHVLLCLDHVICELLEFQVPVTLLPLLLFLLLFHAIIVVSSHILLIGLKLALTDLALHTMGLLMLELDLLGRALVTERVQVLGHLSLPVWLW